MRVLLVSIGAMMLASCASASLNGLARRPPTVAPGGVTFVLMHRSARTVALAGSFNEWSTTSHPLEPHAAGVWTALVPLPPGEHLFMYVIDGAIWLSPPAADDYEDDGFGTRNGVVIVRPN